jgi:hypothetical protein
VSVLTCGAGTTAQKGTCQLDSFLPKRCGTGTELVNDECVPIPSGVSLTCGPGTQELGQECVPSEGGGAGGAAPEVQCGKNTVLVRGECVAVESGAGGAPPSTACGPGTVDAGGICVPEAEAGQGGASGLECGTGTHEVGRACVPDASGGEHFELRLPNADIPADGITKVPVLALGSAADGTPIIDQVLIYPSRVDAGIVNPSTLALEAFGARSSFVACNGATDPNCLGPFELRMVRTSDTAHVLAKVAANLVAPEGIGSALPCQTGGNVWYMDGESGDYIHPGEISIVDGAFSASLSSNGTNLHVSLTPGNQNEGLWWDFYMDSSMLGVPLGVGVWNDAERWPFESADTPGLDVSGDGRGCNMLTGAFQIISLSIASGTVQELTATFRQYCDGGAALNGCVHYATQ